MEPINVSVVYSGATVLVAEHGEVKVPAGQIAVVLHSPGQGSQIVLMDAPWALRSLFQKIAELVSDAEQRINWGRR